MKTNENKVKKMMELLKSNPGMLKRDAAEKVGLAHISSYYTYLKKWGKKPERIYSQKGLGKAPVVRKSRTIEPQVIQQESDSMVLVIGSSTNIRGILNQIIGG